MPDTTYALQFSDNLNNGSTNGTVSGNLSVDYNTSLANGTITATTPNGTDTFTVTNANISNGAGDPNQFTVNSSLPSGANISLTYTGQSPTAFDFGDYQTSSGSVASYQLSTPAPITSTDTTACYCTGTLIRTVSGDVAVEALAAGDIIVTASGEERPIKWIGHRSYIGRFANANPDTLPICFKAGSLADGMPARDLWVSPKHAMVLDGALIAAELLANGISVVKATRVERVEYWHVELDSHDVLLAEGAPSESFVDDNSRGMFHNAPAFIAAHPEAIGVEAIYCAPRLEDGFQLEAIRQAIAARAGIATYMPDCGTLHGYIDEIDAGFIRGWARSSLNPTMAVCLDLVIDGRVIATDLANRRRADLDAAGYGPRGFAFALPAGAEGKPIEVRRSADAARMKIVIHRAA